MNLHDLRQAQASFSVADAIEGRKQLNKLRAAFVKEFSIKHIAEMKIDDYVEGKNKQSFCYRIEWELDGLGRITGAPAIKFGIYYGKNQEYKYAQIWGSNHKIAFENIRKALIELIEAGKNGDIETLVNSRISTMFKGKILSTYYPEKYLNIFSENHLDYYLTFFGLDNEEIIQSDPIQKREVLLAFKNKDKVMKTWPTDVFSNFLYFTYPTWPYKKQKEENVETKEYQQPEFPPAPQIEQIEQTILPPNTEPTDLLNKKGAKPDYDKENRLCKLLGDRGEDLVLKFEQERLQAAGLKALAKKVKRVSLDSDSWGYDILSYNNDKTERYIEVKATRAKPGTANFFLTLNELNTAKEKQENYFIYMVYNILSPNPKIWIIPNPFSPENENVQMEPVNYRVKINAKKTNIF